MLGIHNVNMCMPVCYKTVIVLFFNLTVTESVVGIEEKIHNLTSIISLPNLSGILSLMHGWFDNLLQIDCDTDGQHNPDILRKRNPDDLVEIIQRLQQEAVATGRLFVESKTQAQRVCCTSCTHFPEGHKLVIQSAHYMRTNIIICSNRKC